MVFIHATDLGLLPCMQRIDGSVSPQYMHVEGVNISLGGQGDSVPLYACHVMQLGELD